MPRVAGAAIESLDQVSAPVAEALLGGIRGLAAGLTTGFGGPGGSGQGVQAALAAGVNYLDMAMSLSHPDPNEPYAKAGVKLGDEQFAMADQWQQAGQLALAGIGVEPGLSDVFARHAADDLFSEIDEIGVRDGANLTVAGYDFAPTFSIWTTIEECLNPPVIWEKDRGWYTTAPFSEPETFRFPAGIGPVECVNVEHE